MQVLINATWRRGLLRRDTAFATFPWCSDSTISIAVIAYSCRLYRCYVHDLFVAVLCVSVLTKASRCCRYWLRPPDVVITDNGLPVLSLLTMVSRCCHYWQWPSGVVIIDYGLPMLSLLTMAFRCCHYWLWSPDVVILTCKSLTHLTTQHAIGGWLYGVVQKAVHELRRLPCAQPLREWRGTAPQIVDEAASKHNVT